MKRIASAAMCICIALAACSDSTGPGEDAAGCYDLTLGSWDGEPEEVLPLPASIALRTELGTQVLEDGRRLVRPNPNTDERFYRWAWWEPVPGDSIQLIWSTGFTGIEMRLGRASGGWAGRARNFLDYAPAGTATASVSLARAQCR